MAKFVVAGKVDCAAYARAEMLADRLQFSLPDFHVHKVAVPSEDWAEWVKEECNERGWAEHCGDVMVWRELVKRGGRGMYVGGVSEFEEYASHYYNITPLTDNAIEDAVAMENRQTLAADQLEAESRAKPHPLRVAITAASSQLAYNLLHLLASGDVFGDKQLSLCLLDTPTHSNELSGVAMEIIDMASPVIESVHYTSSAKEAFKMASVVLVLEQWEETESYDRNSEESKEPKNDELEVKKDSAKDKEVEEMKKSDVGGSGLTEAASLYNHYGAVLDFCADKSVKVIVSGRFSNLGAAVISRSAPSIPPAHIVAAACLVEQRAKSAIALRLTINTADVKQVCVWGRCDGVLVDVSQARVHHYQGAITGPDPFSLPLSHCLHDPAWLATGLSEELSRRWSDEKRGRGLSEAVAITELLHIWTQPQDLENETKAWHSVGVVSGGECYSFPAGVACSVPVRCEGGEWEVVKDLQLPPAIQEKLTKESDLLSKELEIAWNFIESRKQH